VTAGSAPRYLAAAEVEAAMPPVDERLRLAERTLVALADGSSELPPKIGVHPRPEGSFGHAMPAHLRGGAADGTDDLVGMKWVVGFPTNRSRGLPTIHATVIVSDPRTGIPLAILDGGPITAARTAAVSGVAVARFAPPVVGRAPRVAIVGAGVQGHSHLAIIGHVLPGASLAVFDRHPERANALVQAAGAKDGIAAAEARRDARDAVADADVVVTAASLTTPDRRQPMIPDWLAPDALVVSVDYATFASAELARTAALFLVDERGQFLANREAGEFDGYPDPSASLGEAILAGTPRPTVGRVLVNHLGVGLADLVFADAILDRSMEA
jgi:ornithine cyclodeaminase/alanine dehydrogenase